ncbi:hypothetical protein [Paenibacillus thiaminolyticus]|uniref:hypothetical protein n=1 Tax=Paenibacillus thiaminolyticus TaxID=49283 RepID=UPI0025433704|nr:hypothetical protein [Paenibacillus thiaminolyticus]WII36737.1 hypothetical protein O0V01_24375 [Paenibacillus thiaminolyticus]
MHRWLHARLVRSGSLNGSCSLVEAAAFLCEAARRFTPKGPADPVASSSSICSAANSG